MHEWSTVAFIACSLTDKMSDIFSKCPSKMIISPPDTGPPGGDSRGSMSCSVFNNIETALAGYQKTKSFYQIACTFTEWLVLYPLLG